MRYQLDNRVFYHLLRPHDDLITRLCMDLSVWWFGKGKKFLALTGASGIPFWAPPLCTIGGTNEGR